MGVLDAPGVPRTRVPVAPAPVSPKLGVYERGHCIYNLKPGHLRRTRSALAKAWVGSGFCNIGFIGDSTTAGYGAVPGVSDWPALFAAMMAERGYPLSGSGIIPANRNIASPADVQVTPGAGWAQWVAGSTILANSTTANPLTFVSLVAGTKVIVHYSNQTGPFTVSIDGAAAVASSAFSTPPTGNPNYGSYEVPGLSDTTHTVVITRTSGTVLIEGFEVQSGAYGIRTYNAGLASLKIEDFAAAPYYTSTNAMIYPRFLADLVLFSVEINDANGPGITPPATYGTTFEQALTNVRAQAPDPDVVLLAANPCNGVDFDDYTQKLYDLADTHDVPLLDVQDRWGTFATANAQGLMSDNLHPTATGYAELATAVIRALRL